MPARLTALVDELRGRFSGFTLQPEAELADAAARGADTIDLEYHLPPEAIQAAADLGAMLDEADEFCRNGDLLTLATPPEALAYRRWFLGEFARQAAGEAARGLVGLDSDKARLRARLRASQGRTGACPSIPASLMPPPSGPSTTTWPPAAARPSSWPARPSPRA